LVVINPVRESELLDKYQTNTRIRIWVIWFDDCEFGDCTKSISWMEHRSLV